MVFEMDPYCLSADTGTKIKMCILILFSFRQYSMQNQANQIQYRDRESQNFLIKENQVIQ